MHTRHDRGTSTVAPTLGLEPKAPRLSGELRSRLVRAGALLAWRMTRTGSGTLWPHTLRLKVPRATNMHQAADLRGALALQPLADVEGGRRRPQLLLRRRGVRRQTNGRG